ncbi:peptidylprolyl isomerase [Crocosphaera sp. XPORK-15E]|uniref:peptidylprolyl isomerase n=1 Tax=Crocosphaera sp. XPORK-15E TaxID=3110247 RepID=UPI002B21D038|nr:peptidylprolyl isomerase [Crocosphaera sp. XPORK-15E]MEA5534021.1 peptidylprolyl isomerase [Crocosphaera sp. XPORK-15E]
MSIVLQIGDQEISDEDLYPLLAEYRLLPQLAKEIIIDQAIADITCTPEETALAQQQFYQKNQLTNEAQLKAWLEYHGMTPQQLEVVSVRDLKIEKFKQLTWSDKLDTYFVKCKGQLDRVVYSLIRTKEAGIAQELYFRIQEGENSFAELARQYSEGSEAQTGGLIGPVELNVPHERIAQILSASRPGQLSPPTRVGEWWIILRLEKYVSAQLDEATRQRLINELFQGWLLAQTQQNVTFSPIIEAVEITQA